SGAGDAIPQSDVIYVNAGASAPPLTWLEALRANGRLLFPLTTGTRIGFMLLVRKVPAVAFSARFVAAAAFTPCIGAQDESTAAKLSTAFAGGGMQTVRSLHLGTQPDGTCWFEGSNWWLSTADAPNSRANE